MPLHEEIRRRRLALGWSMQRLADEVSLAEGLRKPLGWQTVQQWEREGGTMPKASRLATVAAVLGASVEQLVGAPRRLGLDTPQRQRDTAIHVLHDLAELLQSVPEARRADVGQMLNSLARNPADDAYVRAAVSLLEVGGPAGASGKRTGTHG